jgi:hypothetical protein
MTHASWFTKFAHARRSKRSGRGIASARSVRRLPPQCRRAERARSVPFDHWQTMLDIAAEQRPDRGARAGSRTSSCRSRPTRRCPPGPRARPQRAGASRPKRHDGRGSARSYAGRRCAAVVRIATTSVVGVRSSPGRVPRGTWRENAELAARSVPGLVRSVIRSRPDRLGRPEQIQ